MSSTNTKKNYGYIEDANEKIEEYTTGRKETTQKNIDEMNTVYDEQIKQAKDSTLLQEQELTDSYNDIVDANEIQKEINLRQIRENVANMGLSNSGLSSTEQTAAILSASNSNAKAKLQLQKSVDSLRNQLANHITGVEDNRRAYQLSQEQAEEADIAKFTSDISGAAYDAEATAMENDEKNRRSGLDWALDNDYLTEPEYYQYLADGTSLEDIELNLEYKTKAENIKLLDKLLSSNEIDLAEHAYYVNNNTPISEVYANIQAKKDENLRVETLEKMRDQKLISPSQCYSYIQNGTPISQVKINPQQSGMTQAEKNRIAGLEALKESGDINPMEFAQFLTDGTTVEQAIKEKYKKLLVGKSVAEKIYIVSNSNVNNKIMVDILNDEGISKEDKDNYYGLYGEILRRDKTGEKTEYLLYTKDSEQQKYECTWGQSYLYDIYATAVKKGSDETWERKLLKERCEKLGGDYVKFYEDLFTIGVLKEG